MIFTKTNKIKCAMHIHLVKFSAKILCCGLCVCWWWPHACLQEL